MRPAREKVAEGGQIHRVMDFALAGFASDKIKELPSSNQSADRGWLRKTFGQQTTFFRKP
jgi:hypothetical protein